jgi:hypothetical protein
VNYFKKFHFDDFQQNENYSESSKDSQLQDDLAITRIAYNSPKKLQDDLAIAKILLNGPQ